MARLQWDERQCVNPPEGWEIGVESFPSGWYWKAEESVDGGALYSGASNPTEAQARRGCEAALLRLGVLEPGANFIPVATAMRYLGMPPSDKAIKAIAAALAALEVEASDG
jgi:hypothetical protein